MTSIRLRVYVILPASLNIDALLVDDSMRLRGVPGKQDVAAPVGRGRGRDRGGGGGVQRRLERKRTKDAPTQHTQTYCHKIQNFFLGLTDPKTQRQEQDSQKQHKFCMSHSIIFKHTFQHRFRSLSSNSSLCLHHSLSLFLSLYLSILSASVSEELLRHIPYTRAAIRREVKERTPLLPLFHVTYNRAKGEETPKEKKEEE